MTWLTALVAVGLLWVPIAQASVAPGDDDSEQRVRAAPRRIPALTDRLIDVTTWTLRNGSVIDWKSISRDAADNQVRIAEIAAAEAEIDRLEQNRVAERVAAAAQARARHAQNVADWQAAVKANAAHCLEHPEQLCAALPKRPRIRRGSHGKPIVYAAAPFQVAIRYAKRIPLSRFPGSDNPANAPWELRHKCGGGLIAFDWVLTAAHCVSPADLKDGIEVHLGSADISRDGGTVLPVDRVIHYPGYRSSNMYVHDIALLRIARRAGARDTGQTRVLEIAHDDPPDRAAVFAPGWGRIVDASAKPVAILRRYAMRIVPRADCAALPGFGPTKIHSNVLCAGGGGAKTCEGDSGGPLVLDVPKGGREIDYKVVGVVSWNKSICDGKRDPRPGVYTAVAPYAQWIRATISASLRATR